MYIIKDQNLIKKIKSQQTRGSLLLSQACEKVDQSQILFRRIGNIILARKTNSMKTSFIMGYFISLPNTHTVEKCNP
jgi:hypothetical protein